MKLKKNNIILMTDSYKLFHSTMLPDNTQKVYSYFEARNGSEFDELVFYGLQIALLEHLQGSVVTEQDVEEAKKFCISHFGHADGFNYEGWMHIAKFHNGKLPIEICAVPEGTVVSPSNVLMTMVNTGDENTQFLVPYLTGHLETLLTEYMWYGSTVASKSRKIKKIIKKYLNTTSDYPEEVQNNILGFLLHDFSARGVSSLETSGIGGSAHLINFRGTDTIHGMKYAEYYYNADIHNLANSCFACYDKDTEILTNIGFKKFSDLSKEDLVGEYTKDGTINFVIPDEYHEYNYDGNLIKFSKSGLNYVDLLVTPNHKMVRLHNNEIELFEAGNYSDEFFYGTNKKIVISGKTSFIGNSLSDLDRLKIAFQADGSFPSRKDAYNGNKTGTIPVRFSLKKDRKKKRLSDMLDRMNVKYQTSITKNREGHLQYWISLEKTLQKDFEWIDLSKISLEWAKEFLEELKYWDGCDIKDRDVFNYCSTNKSCIDKIQAIASIAEYKTYFSSSLDKRGNRLMLYKLSIKRNKTTIDGYYIKREEVYYKDKVYCVSVPSKMLVVRRNGVVAICGNTEHSIATALGESEEKEGYLKRLLIKNTKGIRSFVGDSFNIERFVDEYIREYKNIIIKQNEDDKGGLTRVVIRPDSPRFKGDTAALQVLWIVEKLWDIFGGIINSKGFKVLHSCCGVIYGDSLTEPQINELYKTLVENKFDVSSIICGMGGGLCQKVNRDTCRFAFKSSAQMRNGIWYDVMKNPLDATKTSKRGRFALVKEGNEFQTIPLEFLGNRKNWLIPVFRDGEILKKYTFDEIRENAKL